LERESGFLLLTRTWWSTRLVGESPRSRVKRAEALVFRRDVLAELAEIGGAVADDLESG
jgi:hypothetical protein